jgi:hypothetical protein
MAHGGWRSGIPDCRAFQRLCPDAPGFFLTSHLVLGPVAQPLRLLEYSTEGPPCFLAKARRGVRGVTARQGEGPCRSTKVLAGHEGPCRSTAKSGLNSLHCCG